MKELGLKSDFGFACYRYCVRYKFLHSHVSRNCKIWETDTLDLSKKEDFAKLRDAGFVLRVEGK